VAALLISGGVENEREEDVRERDSGDDAIIEGW